MEEADKDKDGQISREEFHEAMVKNMRNSLNDDNLKMIVDEEA